jgi:hypothetical protein
MRVIKGYGCIFLLVGGAAPILVLVLLVVLEGVSHPFKDQMECILLCVPRDQSHIS